MIPIPNSLENNTKMDINRVDHVLGESGPKRVDIAACLGFVFGVLN